MPNSLNNFIQKLKNLQLSAADRRDIRAELEEHMAAQQPTPSPWAPILSPLQSVGRRAMVAALVLIALGGVSLAAENALPGDPLYAVKTNVNEGFMEMTSLTPTSEAERESRIAARRIAELEELAARGALGAEVSRSLTTAISEHTASARQQIEKVSSQGETGSATELEAMLLSMLSTHSDILEDLSISNAGVTATTTAEAAQQLRQIAQEKTQAEVSTALEAGSEDAPQRVSATASTGEQLSPEQTRLLLERTANRLIIARRNFDTSYTEFEPSVRSSIEQLLVTSAQAIDTAMDAITDDEYAAAYEHLREALIYAHEATIIINTRQALEHAVGVTADSLLDNNAAFSTSTPPVGSDAADEAKPKTPAATSSTTTTATSSRANATSSATSSDATTTAATGSQSIATTTTDQAAAAAQAGQNFTRRATSSLKAYDRINATLERVREVLMLSDSTRNSGLLPSRTSETPE